jgi:hypothetical protein
MRSLFFQIAFIVFGLYHQQMQTFLLDGGSGEMMFDLVVGRE